MSKKEILAVLAEIDWNAAFTATKQLYDGDIWRAVQERSAKHTGIQIDRYSKRPFALIEIPSYPSKIRYSLGTYPPSIAFSSTVGPKGRLRPSLDWPEVGVIADFVAEVAETVTESGLKVFPVSSDIDDRTGTISLEYTLKLDHGNFRLKTE